MKCYFRRFYFGATPPVLEFFTRGEKFKFKKKIFEC